MTDTQPVSIRQGDVIELWLRARPRVDSTDRAGFAIASDGHCVFRVAMAPPYFEHFRYEHHLVAPAELEWNADLVEISLAYLYTPATVAQDGMTFLEFGPGGVEQFPARRLSEWYAAESGRPTLRFSPFKSWMNDPNGLCKVGESYHLFYQFHPNGIDWGPMHWGHATSEDLIHWRHLPVFAFPEQNLAALGATGGAFSGSSFVDRNGSLSFYYTERLPAYDLFRDYTEIQKRSWPSQDMLRPARTEVVLAIGGPGIAHDIRDPKVWFDVEADLYRMVLGSAVEGDPAIVLFSSPNGLDWSYTSVLYRAPARFREGGARCAECPDFFCIDGTWVLIASFVGYTEAETGRHNLLYALTGSFADGVFIPRTEDLQELDFGTDYYAMQSFGDGSRQLALAWLFNWEFRKPAGSAYSGELSLPRMLSISNGRLIMRPEAGYRQLRDTSLSNDQGTFRPPAPAAAVELEAEGPLSEIRIIGRSSSGAQFVLEARQRRLHITTPEDQESPIVYRSGTIELRQLTVIFDRGIIEIFANGGALCGTRRSYRLDDLAELRVEQANRGARLAAWSLRSAWDSRGLGEPPAVRPEVARGVPPTPQNRLHEQMGG